VFVDLAVSVIMPTFNRRDALLETLAALSRCEPPEGGWEAIVTDDGSTDRTETAVREWIAASGAPVRINTQKNAGPARARNQGAALALGRMLIFIDNDIIVQPDFMRMHLAAQAEHPGCWVVGRIRHPQQLRATPFGRYRDDLWEQFQSEHAPDRITETAGITAANLSLPAADFARLGGFNEGFTIASCEDWELGMRARKEGVRVLYHPGIVVVHNDWAVDLDRFCERQRMYSISDVRLWRMYGDGSPRAEMIRVNRPVEWKQDGVMLGLKKGLKRILATGIGQRMLKVATAVSERVFPDGVVTRKLYDALIGIAIFRGVREGLKRYG
jgi:GT2 family glycosyltransferase